jgi:hypothetical protein
MVCGKICYSKFNGELMERFIGFVSCNLHTDDCSSLRRQEEAASVTLKPIGTFQDILKMQAMIHVQAPKENQKNQNLVIYYHSRQQQICFLC